MWGCIHGVRTSWRARIITVTDGSTTSRRSSPPGHVPGRQRARPGRSIPYPSGSPRDHSYPVPGIGPHPHGHRSGNPPRADVGAYGGPHRHGAKSDHGVPGRTEAGLVKAGHVHGVRRGIGSSMKQGRRHARRSRYGILRHEVTLAATAVRKTRRLLIANRHGAWRDALVRDESIIEEGDKGMVRVNPFGSTGSIRAFRRSDRDPGGVLLNYDGLREGESGVTFGASSSTPRTVNRHGAEAQ